MISQEIINRMKIYIFFMDINRMKVTRGMSTCLKGNGKMSGRR